MRSHDQDFADYFVARNAALRRTAYVIVGDWHVAEDVCQRVFVNLYGAWRRVRPETRDAYVRKMIVNESLTWLRRRPPETELLPRHDRVAPDDETPLDLAAALDRLPPRQRAVVALRFLDDLSVAEVADALQISEGTVKSQTSKALDTLRRHLPALILEEVR